MSMFSYSINHCFNSKQIHTMYKILAILCLVGFALTDATRTSANLQRLTSKPSQGSVGIDFCPICIDEAVEYINIIANIILNEGIVESCGKLCDAVANKTSKLFGDFCLIACDGIGIDEFVHLIISADPDPIWYCELAKCCPSKR